MDQVELHAKIRELMTSGVLPADPPPITRPSPTSTPGVKRSKILVGGPLHEPCTICGEPDPQVQYFYIAGRVVLVHAACDAVWQQERQRRIEARGDY
jgi:hypothetical protein